MSSPLDILIPTDAHGVPVSSLLLSLDHGVWGPGSANIADSELAILKFIGWTTFALLNIVMLFNWLTPVVILLEKVSDSITATFGAIGVFGLAAALAAVVFATHWMKRSTHRIGYHLGMALTLMMVAVVMVSPVRFAAQLITLGGSVGTEIGQKATNSPQSASLSQILATKFLREPVLRANFGLNIDDLKLADGRTCGDLYDAAVLSGQTDTVKDAVKPCPAGSHLHNYAMHPTSLQFDLLTAIGCMLVLAVFVYFIMFRILRTGVATLLHAGFVKPSASVALAGPAAQVLALRNAIAIPTGFLTTVGNILALVVGAAFTAFIAQATGSSGIASLVTSAIMVGLVLGTTEFGRNLSTRAREISEQIGRSHMPTVPGVSAEQIRNAATKATVRATSLASTLAGHPEIGVAASALGPGVVNRASQPRRQALPSPPPPVSFPHQTPTTPPTAAPAGQAPAPTPAAAASNYPIDNAARVADQIHQHIHQPAVTNTNPNHYAVTMGGPPGPMPSTPGPAPAPVTSRRIDSKPASAPPEPGHTDPKNHHNTHPRSHSPNTTGPPTPNADTGHHHDRPRPAIPTLDDDGNRRAADTASAVTENQPPQQRNQP